MCWGQLDKFPFKQKVDQSDPGDCRKQWFGQPENLGTAFEMLTGAGCSWWPPRSEGEGSVCFLKPRYTYGDEHARTLGLRL